MTSFEHKGFTVSLDERFQFNVTGEGWPENGRSTYPSAEEAKAAIDKIYIGREKEAKAKARVAVEVLSDSGEVITLRGIHSTTSRVLTSQKGYGGSIYPNVGWLREALEKRERLTAEVKTINHQIAGYAIRGQVTYGRLDPERYDAVLADLLKRIELATTRAERHAQP